MSRYILVDEKEGFVIDEMDSPNAAHARTYLMSDGIVKNHMNRNAHLAVYVRVGGQSEPRRTK